MSVSEETDTQTIGEVLLKYARFRRLWIAYYGTVEGFTQWFTREVMR